MTVATTTLVEMDAEGHLTLPEEIRRALQADGKAILLVRTTEEGVTMQAIPEEDAWAYTPEMRQRIAQAQQEFREGKAFELSIAELAALIGVGPVDDDQESR